MMAGVKISRVLQLIKQIRLESGFKQCNWNASETNAPLKKLLGTISTIKYEEVAFNPANMSHGSGFQFIFKFIHDSLTSFHSLVLTK